MSWFDFIRPAGTWSARGGGDVGGSDRGISRPGIDAFSSPGQAALVDRTGFGPARETRFDRPTSGGGQSRGEQALVSRTAGSPGPVSTGSAGPGERAFRQQLGLPAQPSGQSPGEQALVQQVQRASTAPIPGFPADPTTGGEQPVNFRLTRAGLLIQSPGATSQEDNAPTSPIQPAPVPQPVQPTPVTAPPVDRQVQEDPRTRIQLGLARVTNKNLLGI